MHYSIFRINLYFQEKKNKFDVNINKTKEQTGKVKFNTGNLKKIVLDNKNKTTEILINGIKNTFIYKQLYQSDINLEIKEL